MCDGRDSDVSALVADVYAFEHRLTRFDPASELSRFNATAGARVPVSALLRELLSACLDAYALSAGLVNAACLPALIAAGYDRSITEIHRHPAARVRHAAGRPVPPLPAILEIGNGWAALAPGCAVDLGGVGKGWLADTLCERFDNAAINLGGDIRVRGAGLEGPWVARGAVRWQRSSRFATPGSRPRDPPDGAGQVAITSSTRAPVRLLDRCSTMFRW